MHQLNIWNYAFKTITILPHIFINSSSISINNKSDNNYDDNINATLLV